MARAYGLPKIHKPNNPLRMIVSLVDSLSYKLSKWMFVHPRPLIAGSEHSISNSPQFLESIKHTNKAPDECMVSFDVVSLFTCIPLELARETIVYLLDDFDLNLPPTATIEMLEHCLSNYFQFGNCYYQLIKGTPMGSRYLGSSPKPSCNGLKGWFSLSSHRNSGKGMLTTPSSS